NPCPDRSSVRADLWAGKNQRGIHICNFVTSDSYAPQSFREEQGGVCSLPARVSRREQCADIRRIQGPQQSVSDGVQQDIAIGVSAEAFGMRDFHAANFQRYTALEFM